MALPAGGPGGRVQWRTLYRWWEIRNQGNSKSGGKHRATVDGDNHAGNNRETGKSRMVKRRTFEEENKDNVMDYKTLEGVVRVKGSVEESGRMLEVL